MSVSAQTREHKNTNSSMLQRSEYPVDNKAHKKYFQHSKRLSYVVIAHRPAGERSGDHCMLACCVRLRLHPTDRPSVRPSVHPSDRPSVRPSIRPSVLPSVRPTVRPSVRAAVRPSDKKFKVEFWNPYRRGKKHPRVSTFNSRILFWG